MVVVVLDARAAREEAEGDDVDDGSVEVVTLTSKGMD